MAVRICDDYFMIDALAGGNVIRKRKYRRENTFITTRWYDYNGVEVTDPAEITRLDNLATSHQRVDKAYDDHADFMASTNYVTSLSGIPMDKHMVVVEWSSEDERGLVSMRYPEGLDGDSYYIVIINTGDKQATVYTPVDDEPPKDGARISGGDSVSVGGSYVSISPKQVERIRVTYRGGKWYYELVTKVYPSDAGGIKIGDVDFVTFRYLWESSSGRDLDTMTEVLNSNIPTIDNKPVGYSGSGNGDENVRNVLKWGGDNTGSGKECVWMSVRDLRKEHYDELPDETQFMAYATWYGERGTGKCSFELIGYKGGEMHHDGYNFINDGGSVVYQNTYDFVCDTHRGSSSYKTSYTQVARITYNKVTNEVYMSIGDAIKEEDNYEILERKIETIIADLNKVKTDLETVRRIAEGKNSAYIFDTKSEMDEWLANPDNTSKLRVGDSFWIRELDVPDYWWDGTSAIPQEGPKIDLSPYATIGYVDGVFKDHRRLIQQCLYVTVASEPDEGTVSYQDGGETVQFSPGAVVRWTDADGNDRFYKLVEIAGGKAKWVKLIDTRYGNVTLEEVYDKDYTIINVTSGSRLKGVSSDVDMLKIVNSASGNVTLEFDATVSRPVKALTSLLKPTTVVLTPGAAAELTLAGDKYRLSQLFGVTIFPDLADANREGDWAVTVSKDGKPVLMEVVDMRKWDESIVKELTIDELNEKFPDVEVGFAVVCKTIGKVYEMVNGYKEWISYDIRSVN